MRNEAPVGDKRGTGKAATSSFSRVQALAFVVGALQVVLACVPFLPMHEGTNHTLYVCTGVAGVLASSRHTRARLYGVALVLLYGQLFISDAAETGPLGLPTLETLAYGRAALAGLVIALIPAFKRRR